MSTFSDTTASLGAPRTGGRILVDQLRIQSCDRIFTVPGESFLAVLDALHAYDMEARSKI